MAFTKVTAAGIGTTQPLELTGVNLAGVVTATGLNVTGVATFTSNVSIAGTLTYEDVTNIDSVGLITARSGISITGGDLVVGSAVTISQDNIFTTGIVTASQFSGDGSQLTGVASTDNIRTNTNATFLQNISVTGTGITVGDGNILGGDSFMRKHAIGIGSTNTAGRDAGIGTAVGTLIFNTDRGAGVAQVYNGTTWVDFGSNAIFTATGGTKDTTSRSGYIVHTFTSPGTFETSGPSATVEYLVVAGGGGGGSQHGGGGGAGGYRTGTLPVIPGSYTVTVGAGGNGTGGVGSPPNAPVYGSNGSNSVFATITSTGGGRGGIYSNPPSDNNRLGNPGGSAGGNGAAESDTTHPSVSPGNAGGFSPPEGQAGGNGRYAGGGGGGAATNGSTVSPASPYTTSNGGNGGNGSASSITGSPVLYAGGGGGGTHNPVAPAGQGGIGGPGGGGRGGFGSVAGVSDSPVYSGNDGPTATAGGNDGVANRGGGGGGGSRYQASGGAGGSGVVIVAYPTSL